MTPEALHELDKRAVDYSEVPELTDEFWSVVSTQKIENKQQLTLRLDADILDFFRGSGPKYQTRINAVLRSYVNAQKKLAQ